MHITQIHIYFVDHSYMFRLLERNHHQAEHPNCKKKIIYMSTFCRRDLGFTNVVTYIEINKKIYMYKHRYT